MERRIYRIHLNRGFPGWYFFAAVSLALLSLTSLASCSIIRMFLEQFNITMILLISLRVHVVLKVVTLHFYIKIKGYDWENPTETMTPCPFILAVKMDILKK